MKLDIQAPPAVSRGLNEVTDFSINVTAQAFSILSSGLYKNPIKAIIRELSTNAVDAHIEAGTTDKPFDVEFPTRLNPTFRIRDYGVGLSKKDVLGLYSTYFSSTKTDTNEQVGALGLGSKSPLGYTNSFSVVSYFNGTKYNFSVFIGDNGFPNIAVTGEGDTDEHNGLEIIVPVKEDHYYMNKWYDNAKSVYKYFDVTPNILGAEIEIEKPKYERVINNVHIIGQSRKFFNNDSGFNVVQGNIAYPLSLIEADINKQIIDVIGNLDADIHVNIGDVSFLPNREELSYDDKTKKTIKESLENFVDELSKDIDKSISDIRTFNDAHKTFYDIVNNFLSLINYKTDLKEKLKVKLDRWRNFTEVDVTNYAGSINYRVPLIMQDVTEKFEKAVLVRDGKRIKDYYSAGYYSNGRPIIFWINDTNKAIITKFGKVIKDSNTNILIPNVENVADTIKWIKHKYNITNKQFKYISDLEFPETVTVKKEGLHCNKIRLISYSNNYYGTRNWRWERGLKVDNFDNGTDEYVWVEQKGHTATGYYSEDIKNLPEFLGGEDSSYWDLDAVYGIKTKDVDDIKKRSNWIHINDYVKRYINNYIKSYFDHNVTYTIDDLFPLIRLSNKIDFEEVNNVEIQSIFKILQGISGWGGDSVTPKVKGWINMLNVNDLSEIGIDFNHNDVYNDGYSLNTFIKNNYQDLDIVANAAESFENERIVNLINTLY